MPAGSTFAGLIAKHYSTAFGILNCKFLSNLTYTAEIQQYYYQKFSGKRILDLIFTIFRTSGKQALPWALIVWRSAAYTSLSAQLSQRILVFSSP